MKQDFALFYSEIVNISSSDNRWVEIETWDCESLAYDWIKVDRIPDYEKLKIGDVINISYINKDDRPVIGDRLSSIYSYDCDVNKDREVTWSKRLTKRG